MTQDEASKAEEFGIVTEQARHVHRNKVRVTESSWLENVILSIEIDKQCHNTQEIKVLMGT